MGSTVCTDCDNGRLEPGGVSVGAEIRVFGLDLRTWDYRHAILLMGRELELGVGASEAWIVGAAEVGERRGGVSRPRPYRSSNPPCHRP